VNSADLPQWPMGWYTVARSSEVVVGSSMVGAIAGQDYLLFRGESGQLTAVDRHCPHMGADLVHGDVVGEDFRCSLHHWRVSTAGTVCSPSGRSTRTRVWPVYEAAGLIFLGHGTNDATPPFANLTEGRWTTIQPLDLDLHWHHLMVNSFDIEHLTTVHKRDLLGEPQLTQANGALTLDYTSKVSGAGLSDMVMKRLSGGRIEVVVTNHGTVNTVESRIGRHRTRAILGVHPQAQGVRAYGAMSLDAPGWLGPLALWLTKQLFVSFLERDFVVLHGMRLRIDGEDQGVSAICNHLASIHEPVCD
jgi:aminopyrrolnitrin oxygenase